MLLWSYKAFTIRCVTHLGWDNQACCCCHLVAETGRARRPGPKLQSSP